MRDIKLVLLFALIISMLLYVVFFPKPFNLLTFKEGTSQEEMFATERQMKELIVNATWIFAFISVTVASSISIYTQRKKEIL